MTHAPCMLSHLEYLIFIAVPLHQWLHDLYSMLRYTYFACLAVAVLYLNKLYNFDIKLCIAILIRLYILYHLQKIKLYNIAVYILKCW